MSIPKIAVMIGRDRTTVWRELRRNNAYRGAHLPEGERSRHPRGRHGRGTGELGGVYRWVYCARSAQARYRVRALRPRRYKLLTWRVGRSRWQAPRLWQVVLAKLKRRWSPTQISAWLKETYPDDSRMHVSHETIYQAIYVQARGTLRKDLAAHEALRSGRASRKPQGRAARTGRGIRSWTEDFNISQRPAEAGDRAVPGHWEGDLVIGKGGQSAIITLVERTTRYVMLGALHAGRDSATVIDTLVERMSQVPAHLARSLTWDQGSEMRQHARFTLATGCAVYFADPHSPWMRGTNENTNGLLRQYFPKGVTNFDDYSQTQLDEIAAELNERPRQTLGWKSPAQRLNELLVATAA